MSCLAVSPKSEIKIEINNTSADFRKNNLIDSATKNDYNRTKVNATRKTNLDGNNSSNVLVEYKDKDNYNNGNDNNGNNFNISVTNNRADDRSSLANGLHKNEETLSSCYVAESQSGLIEPEILLRKITAFNDSNDGNQDKSVKCKRLKDLFREESKLAGRYEYLVFNSPTFSCR